MECNKRLFYIFSLSFLLYIYVSLCLVIYISNLKLHLKSFFEICKRNWKAKKEHFHKNTSYSTNSSHFCILLCYNVFYYMKLKISDSSKYLKILISSSFVNCGNFVIHIKQNWYLFRKYTIF